MMPWNPGEKIDGIEWLLVQSRESPGRHVEPATVPSRGPEIHVALVDLVSKR